MAKKITPVDEARAIAHPIRVRILEVLAGRTASPSEIAKEIGEGVSNVSYHIKVLRTYGGIKMVREEPVRGAVEHFYRATGKIRLGLSQPQRAVVLKVLNDWPAGVPNLSPRETEELGRAKERLAA